MKTSYVLVALSYFGVFDKSITVDASLIKHQKPALVVPAQGTTKNKILGIRGGGISPLDPDTAAKILGGLYLTNGAACTVAPNAVVSAYGFEGELNAINYSVLQCNGATLLSMGLVAYGLLFCSDCDQNLALGIGALPLACKFLSSLLESDADTIGPAKAKEFVALAIHSIAAYGGLISAEWAPSAFKVLSVFAFLVGIHMPLSASSAINFWEVKNTDENTEGCVETLGANYAVLGALYAALAWDITSSPAKAFGYASLAALALYSKVFLFSSKFDVLGCDRSKFVFWVVTVAVVAASTLLE